MVGDKSVQLTGKIIWVIPSLLRLIIAITSTTSGGCSDGDTFASFSNMFDGQVCKWYNTSSPRVTSNPTSGKCFVTYGPYGNHASGSNFSHEDAFIANGSPTAFYIRHSVVIDALQVMHNHTQEAMAGQNGGVSSQFSLRDSEVIVAVGVSNYSVLLPDMVRYNCITRLTFYTSDMRIYGPFGKWPHTFDCVYPGTNMYLAYLSGSAGGLLDSLNFHFEVTPVFGNWTGWSACNTSCPGISYRNRTRNCTISKAQCWQDVCAKLTQGTELCSFNTTSWGWTPWSSWGGCDVTCDNGTVSRSRQCLGPSPECHADYCPGNTTDIGHCSQLSCSFVACNSTCVSGLGICQVNTTDIHQSYYCKSLPNLVVFDNTSKCLQFVSLEGQLTRKDCLTPASTPVSAVKADNVNQIIFWSHSVNSVIFQKSFSDTNNTRITNMSTTGIVYTIEVSPVDQILYYYSNLTIWKVSYNFTGSTRLLNVSKDIYAGLALNPQNKTLYYNIWDQLTLQVTVPPYTSSSTAVTLTYSRPRGLFYDSQDLRLFGVVNNIATGQLSGNVYQYLTQSSPSVLIKQVPGGKFYGIAYYNGTIYTTDETSRKIYKIPLDGSNYTVLATVGMTVLGMDVTLVSPSP